MTRVRALPRDKKKEGKDAPLEKLRSMVVGKPTGISIWKCSFFYVHCEKNLVFFCFILSCFNYTGLKDHDGQ